MRKSAKIILSLILVLTFLTVMFGCDNKTSNIIPPKVLSVEAKLKRTENLPSKDVKSEIANDNESENNEEVSFEKSLVVGKIDEVIESVYITIKFENPQNLSFSNVVINKRNPISASSFLTNSPDTLMFELVPDDSDGIVEYTISQIGFIKGVSVNPSNLNGLDKIKLNQNPQFLVTLDLSNSDSAEVIEKEMRYMENFNEYYNLTPIKTGMSFMGFFTQKNGEGQRFDKTSVCTFDSDITLYSHFQSFYNFEEKGDYVILKSLTPLGKSQNSHDLKEYALINGKPLKEIGENAFSGSSISRLELNDALTVIGKNAFKNTMVSMILFGNDASLTTIDDGAFQNCTMLKNFNFPKTLSVIGANAFQNSGLNRTPTPEGMGTAGYPMYDVLLINTNIKFIGSGAFAKSLFKEIRIVGRETSDLVLGESVFAESLNLEKVYLSCTITELGFVKESDFSIVDISIKAFNKCEKLTTIFFPKKNLETIGESAFAFTSVLNKIDVPDSVIIIEKNSFMSSGITEVIFGQNSELTTLGDFAFRNCNSLREMKINSTKFLNYGLFPFYNSSNFCNVFFKAENKINVAFEYSSGSLSSNNNIYFSTEMKYFVPKAAEMLYKMAFKDINENLKFMIFSNEEIFEESGVKFSSSTVNGQLTLNYVFDFGKKIAMPSTVGGLPIVKIGKFAVHKNVEEVVLPSGLKEIADEAFLNRTKLKDVDFNNAPLESIGNSAFKRTAIVEFISNSDIKEIKKEAFAYSSLKYIELLNGNQIAVGVEAFANNAQLENVVIGNNVKSLGERAFSSCNNLLTAEFKDVEFPPLTVGSMAPFFGNSPFFKIQVKNETVIDNFKKTQFYQSFEYYV